MFNRISRVKQTAGTAHAWSRRAGTAGRGLMRALFVLCFLVSCSVTLLPAGRALARSLAILPGVLSASQPLWLAPVEEPITHTRKILRTSSGSTFLDIYAPAAGAPPVPGSREGMLVITGVGDNRQVPQVINFLQTIARAGLVVMNVTTPGLLADRVDPTDTDAVVQAFQVLQHWPGVGSTRAGMFGISAGSALICLASADPRIQNQVAFISLLGGLFDARQFLQELGQRAQSVDGQLQPWHPVLVPLQALASTIAASLPGDDGQTLINAFANYPTTALSADQLSTLAPASVASYHLLAGDQPDQVGTNLAVLGPSLRTLLSDLSPSTIVSRLRPPIYLLADRNDQYVPASQSRAFAAALARLHHPYDFAEFGIFQHAEVRSGLGLTQLLGDGNSLLRLINEVTQHSV